jgi:hypothetical protein
MPDPNDPINKLPEPPKPILNFSVSSDMIEALESDPNAEAEAEAGVDDALRKAAQEQEDLETKPLFHK